MCSCGKYLEKLQILTNFLQGVGLSPRNNRLDFTGNLDHDPAPRILDQDHRLDPELLKDFFTYY